MQSKLMTNPRAQAVIIGLSCFIVTSVALYLPDNFPLWVPQVAAILLGVIAGFHIRKQTDVSRRLFMVLCLLSFGTYYLLSMALEIMLYQPWHQLPLEGYLVDLFTLRSLYNSSLIIFFLVISFIAATLPIVFSRHFWKHYQK